MYETIKTAHYQFCTVRSLPLTTTTSLHPNHLPLYAFFCRYTADRYMGRILQDGSFNDAACSASYTTSTSQTPPPPLPLPTPLRPAHRRAITDVHSAPASCQKREKEKTLSAKEKRRRKRPPNHRQCGGGRVFYFAGLSCRAGRPRRSNLALAIKRPLTSRYNSCRPREVSRKPPPPKFGAGAGKVRPKSIMVK